MYYQHNYSRNEVILSILLMEKLSFGVIKWCSQYSVPGLSSVQLLSCGSLFAISWTAARQASLSITNFQSLLKLMSAKLWCHPTISSSIFPFSSCLQSFPASGFFPMSQFFTSGGQIIGFSLSISPSNEYSGLISFRIDWLDLLAVQGTLKSLLQHHSSKASILLFCRYVISRCFSLYTLHIS